MYYNSSWLRWVCFQKLTLSSDIPCVAIFFVIIGTTGSIDGNNCLIVKGRFQQKHFESVLRKYISELHLSLGYNRFYKF